jgi:hypothetical protein
MPWLAASKAVRHRSADSTTIAFNPDRYEPEILRSLDRLDRQTPLPFHAPLGIHDLISFGEARDRRGADASLMSSVTGIQSDAT